MNVRKIVCYDLEMCCWDDPRATGEIIEIGVAEIDLATQTICRRAQYYVKPDKNTISDYCTNLTGITQSKVTRSGRSLQNVLQSMTDKFGSNNKIYASWGRDDLVLKKECGIKRISCPIKETLNLAPLFKIHKRILDDKSGVGMRVAMDMQGLEFEGRPHGAYDDSYNLARLALTFL